MRRLTGRAEIDAAAILFRRLSPRRILAGSRLHHPEGGSHSGRIVISAA